MTELVEETEAAVLNPAAAPHLAGSERRTILVYCGILIIALNLVTPASGFQVIPVGFLLKNKLHFTAPELAAFSLWASIPGYLSFAFGVARDSWSPFGLGDRGYLILFGFLEALVFTIFAFVPPTEFELLIVTILTSFCFLFTWGAWNGLGSVIGQQFAMSGQISALWNFLGTVTIFVALMFGGVFSDWLETMSASDAIRVLFLSVAAVMLLIAAFGVWKPDAVYRHLHATGEKRNLIDDLRRLFRHRAIYPALGIWLCWNFSPGGSTVLQYYASDILHATDTQWGEYAAISTGAAVPTFLLFGYLSSRYPLSKLLWIGAIVALPQALPLLLVSSPNQLILSAIPIGLLGGIATAAYMDLLIRSCPKGLEGTMMMMSWSMYSVSVNVGNLLGTKLYEWSGFFICIAATTFVYFLILPLLAFVPKELIATADAQATE